MSAARSERAAASRAAAGAAPDDAELRNWPPGSAGGALVHESSYVDEGAVLGAGTRVWHFCHVMRGAVLGERCSLGQNVVVMTGVRLGRNVKVQNNVSLYEGVTCDDDVFLGPSMVFTNVVNPRSHISRRDEYRPTHVGRGATVGANATVVCGHTLGEFSFVGAGAVVTHDVPAYAMVVGVPARIAGWMCACGVQLPLPATLAWGELSCTACGLRYAAAPGALTSLGTG